MGTNPSAKLFYGYVWVENDVIDIDTSIDHLAKQMVATTGVTNPFDRFERAGGLNHAAFAEANRVEIDAWRAAKARAMEEIGVDWGLHGSEYDLRHHLYALGSLVEVEWSDTTVITDLALNQVGRSYWAQKLNGYLAKVNITKPAGFENPAWHLACLYF